LPRGHISFAAAATERFFRRGTTPPLPPPADGAADSRWWARLRRRRLAGHGPPIERWPARAIICARPEPPPAAAERACGSRMPGSDRARCGLLAGTIASSPLAAVPTRCRRRRRHKSAFNSVSERLPSLAQNRSIVLFSQCTSIAKIAKNGALRLHECSPSMHTNSLLFSGGSRIFSEGVTLGSRRELRESGLTEEFYAFAN